MTGPTPSRLSDEDRQTFAAIADLLIPSYGKMPAATEEVREGLREMRQALVGA